MPPRRRRFVLLAVAVSAALAACGQAVALPGDPAVTPIGPSDGARGPTDPQGIEVRYACPAYGRYVDGLTGITVEGSFSDYRVGVAADAATGTDGRLAAPFFVGGVYGVGEGPTTCAARLGSTTDFTEDRPHRRPGTYFWQVWRRCDDCAGGYEVGPVWRLTVTLGAKLALTAPKVAYGGYPVLTRVRLTGASTSDPVVVQRRVGRSWRTIATTIDRGDLGDGEVSAVLLLPRGTQRLRAALTRGADTVTSPEVAITVRPGARRVRPGADGAYRDRRHDALRVSIAGGGSVLRTFRAAVTMTCPRPGQPLAPPDVRPGLISAPPVRIAPDGRFVARRNAASGVTYWLEGRLTGTVVTGYASLRVGSCSGDLRFTARRR